MIIDNNQDYINLIYNITSIYNKLDCVEEIILKEYPNNKIALYIKVKNNYINDIGYLIGKGITQEEETTIENTINDFNKIYNNKITLSSNINSQKYFGTFNNTYNNKEPISEYTLYSKNTTSKKLKNK